MVHLHPECVKLGAVEHALWPIFDAVATAMPDRDALRWRGRRWTYAELRDRSLRLAAVLRAAGLGRHTGRDTLEPWESGQDLVATYLLNGPEYLEVTLGGYAAATAPFNVNYRYVADELAYLLDDSSAGAVVYHERFAPVLAEVLPRLDPAPRLLLQVADGSGEALLPGALDYESALADAPPLAEPDVSPDDLYVLYTGGTTGRPKGTLWRQADIWMAALGGDLTGDVDLPAVVAAALGADLRFLPNAPLMHGAAHWIAMRHLLGGGTVVINDTVDRLDTAEAAGLIETHRINNALFVGEAMLRPFIDEVARTTADLSSLFLVVLGGAATSPETKERLLELLPAVMVLDAAGASETGTGLSSVSTRAATAGAGVFDATPAVAVLSPDLDAQLAPGDDEIGWYAKSGHIPLGYLGDPDKTAATFPVVDGRRWSVPGDRARWLADGRIELLGRDSVTINTGGEKVFAEEVEAALLLHPAVRDVTVVGRPSERWGSEVVAVVSLADPSVTDEELLAVAGEQLARYKLPKAIVLVDEVVRSPAAKADYRWARDVAVSAEDLASIRPALLCRTARKPVRFA